MTLELYFFQIADSKSAHRITRRQQQQNRITKTMGIVLGTYYFLYLPGVIETSIKYDNDIKFYISKLVVILFFANSLINPVIYAWQNKDFNAAFR